MKQLFFYLCLTLIFLSGTHALASGSKMGKSSTISELQISDMDGNKNGSISFEEFKAAFPSIRPNVFSILDKNQDGQLNKAEWQSFQEMHKGMGG